MSQVPHHEFRETKTLRVARFIVRNRVFFGLALIGITLFFFYPILNMFTTAFGHPLSSWPIVRVDTSARALFPDHPYIHAQDKFAKRFGSSSLVAVAVVVKDGTIFTPETLRKVREITQRLDGVGFESHTDEREALREQLEEAGVPIEEIRDRLDRLYPPYPVNHNQINSVAHGSTRVIQIEADGSLTQDVLVKKLPETQEEADRLRDLVRQNPPYIFGRLVSRDEKGALITAGFVTDRLSNAQVYTAVFDHVQGIKREFEDPACRVVASGNFLTSFGRSLKRIFVTTSASPEWPEGCNLQVFVSGEPINVGWVIRHAREILIYVSLTVLTIFALLWLYFRRWHGVLLPMVAAMATVIWGLGFTGWMSMTFDPLILVIPMIITARAVSHTVQMAERFFEDYEVMLPRYGDPKVAKVEVATIAMGELIVPGTLGIATDVAGLLVIMVTSIPQMQNLAIFGAFWVLAIIATVELLHPIMICYLPAPTEHEHFLPPIMVRFTRAVGNATTHPVGKYVIGAVTVILFVGSTYIALFHSKIGEATPGTPLLWPDHEFNVATAEIADRFGGVDALVVYADGDRPNAAADSDPIKAMERFERYLATQTNLGASVSLVPFLRNYWMINHYGDPKWYFIPSHPGTVRAAIFQLQQNGAPGFMRPYMTDDGRKANISFFYPDHKGETVVYATHFAELFIEDNPLGEISIRLDPDHAVKDAGFFDPDNLKDMAYYMFGPLASGIAGPRKHTLSVRIRQQDGSYVEDEVTQAGGDGLPDWIEKFRDGAVSDYEDARDSVEEGEYFSWPERLANWDVSDIDAWWESAE